MPVFLRNTLSRMRWLKCTSALLLWAERDAEIKSNAKNNPRNLGLHLQSTYTERVAMNL